MIKKLSILLIVLITLSVQAQSTEKFIRIIGNAKHEFNADGLKLTIKISETKESKYKETKAASFEENFNRFLDTLNSVGIKNDRLKLADINFSKYSRGLSKDYFLTLNNIDDLDKLSNKTFEGFSISKIMYTFNNIDKDIENKMAIQAIEDAKRKAKTLAAEINKKVGKILNIEDTSNGCCKTIDENKESKLLKKYTVKVTFQLK